MFNPIIGGIFGPVVKSLAESGLLDDLGQKIGDSIAGYEDDNGDDNGGSNEDDNLSLEGPPRVLPGKEIILPVSADSSQARDQFSRSLSGLSQDVHDRLWDIKRQTEIATGSPLEQAYRSKQLRSNIERDRALSMPTRTPWSDVNQFRDPYYSDSGDWDLADSRNAAKDTWIDAATIANAAKTAAYGTEPDFVTPTDRLVIPEYEKKGWEYFPEGLKDIPAITSQEWLDSNQVNLNPDSNMDYTQLFDGSSDDIGEGIIDGDTFSAFLNKLAGVFGTVGSISG